MKTIKSIQPWSLAKISGSINAAFGFIIGAVFTLLSLFANSFFGSAGFSGFGVASIILLPIFYGIMGWIAGYVAAWVYNKVADRLGGLEIEFSDMGETTRSTAQEKQ